MLLGSCRLHGCLYLTCILFLSLWEIFSLHVPDMIMMFWHQFPCPFLFSCDTSHSCLCLFDDFQHQPILPQCVYTPCIMSHSDRSRSPTSRRSGSALSRADLRFSSLAWTHWISSQSLISDVQPSDRTQMVGTSVGILSTVPTSDARPTHASLHFDSASSFSTKLPFILSTSTKHSSLSTFSTLSSNSTLSTDSSSSHQPLQALQLAPLRGLTTPPPLQRMLASLVLT